jgi:DNA primase
MKVSCLECCFSDFDGGHVICRYGRVPLFVDIGFAERCVNFRDVFVVTAEESLRVPLSVNAYYPSHPERVMVKKNRFIPKALTEADVWEYYDKVKRLMIPFFKNKDVFLGIVGDEGQKIFKRHPSPKVKEYITINNIADFDKYNNGRTVEFYIAERDRTDVAIIDTDPGEGTTFERIKEHTLKAYDIMDSLEMVAETEILYTGKRGFHVWGWLHRRRNIDDVREELWDVLEREFADDEHITITKKPQRGQIRMDISINKTAGVHIAPLSIRVETGLVSFWVPKNRVMDFDKTEHTTDKILRKVKGKKKI